MAIYECESVTKHLVTLSKCDVELIDNRGTAVITLGNGDVLHIRIEKV